MHITNSIIRNLLDHVYWITGGACAGKTTTTGILAKRHGFHIFPDRHSEYQDMADLDDFPALRIPKPGTDWEWFFSRPVDEYVEWLESSVNGGLQFLLVDLLRTSSKKKILIDTVADPALLRGIAGPHRLVCLLGADDMIRRDLLERDDHRMILECIQANTGKPAEYRANVEEASVEFSRRVRKSAEAIGAPVLLRTKSTTREAMARAVEECFGLVS